METTEDVGRLELGHEPGRPVVYLTQTTLATDETAQIVAALRGRFPRSPPRPRTTSATPLRTARMRSARSPTAATSCWWSVRPIRPTRLRLVEVAQREGCRAELIEDVSHLELGWLAGARTIGLTAGASAPDLLVQEVLDTLRSLGPLRLSEERTAEETVRFALPTQVR